MEKVRGFEIAKGFEDKNINLPERKTKYSAAYDLEAAEDTVIPAFKMGMKPTLIKTGLKAYMMPDEVLIIVPRSSGPKKQGILFPHSMGVIDKDYYGNDLGSFNVVITNDIAESDETPEVISAETDTRVAYANQNFTVTVVTNKGAAKVGIYNEYGSDIGKALVNKVIDSDSITWTFNINVGSKGLRTFTVKAADTLGQWSDSSQQFKVSIVK